MSANQTLSDQKAVVMGASMAGLLAARVFSGHFAEVVLLERDIFPEGIQNRKGVPQGRHLHALLASGTSTLENLFPGLTADLQERGATVGDGTSTFYWYFEGGFHALKKSEMRSIAISRPGLETYVRQRVLDLPNITVVQNCEVLGLVTTEDKSRVSGVRLLSRAAGSAEEILEADLVIDCTGRGSRSPVWLEQLGYPVPPEEKVQVGIGYVTCHYPRHPEQLDGKIGVVVTPSDEIKRFGVMQRQESGNWLVTLGGYFGEHPGLNEESFIEFARSLASPVIYQALQNSRPLDTPAQNKFPYSQRRYYENLKKFPAGFLVFGDAICSFNPMYAQGMSVAALQAAALEKCLAENNDGSLATRFFKLAARVIDTPWQSAVGNDLRYPETQGRRSRKIRFINWYIKHLHRAAHNDPVVALAFRKVTNLLAAPPSLLSPGIVWRVWQAGRRKNKHQPASLQNQVAGS